MTPRARFAPSPTGFLHLGSARTALFNYLFARSVGGEFFLRIEDTDRDRSKPELIQMIFDSLDWLGLDWDNRGAEMYQSDREGAHQEAIGSLLAAGRAYACDCSQGQVQERNAQAGRPPGYDGFCRDRDLPVVDGLPVRFAVPESGTVGWDDLIRGRVEFQCENLEDFVLRRSDGSPVFLIANAVDDQAQGITHVIRGEDLVNVTPKVLLLRDALGYEGQLTFAHLPLIVNEQRKKLSKRRDDVALGDFTVRGFLPEAMVNYLALLGWGPPDGIEVRPVEELSAPGFFDVSSVSPSPAAFDIKKLESVNGDHIRMLTTEEFLRRSWPFFEQQAWASLIDGEVLAAIAPELQTRVRTLAEVPGLVDFMFLPNPEFDEASVTAALTTNADAPAILKSAAERIASVEWSAEALHSTIEELAVTAGLKLGKAQAPIRVAVTGRRVGPPLFEALSLMDRRVVLDRIEVAKSLVAP